MQLPFVLSMNSYVASNASGKPHCDFSFTPLSVVHAKMLIGGVPKPHNHSQEDCLSIT